MPTRYGERLAAVETELRAIRADVTETKADVKVLVAAHNRQKGAARLVAMLWAGLLSIAGLIAGLFLGKPHA